jgi:Epoxide hydrolase N terminus
VTVTHFQVAVPDEVLGDLQERLQRTRFTGASGPAPWAAGTDPGYLRELVAYWADGFDWRGGHFMSHEEPGQTARELTEFFRPLRTVDG